MEGPIDDPAPWVGGTVLPQRADLADGRISSVLLPLPHLVSPTEREHFALWTDIDIPLSVVGEYGGAVEGRGLLPVRQGHEGPDAVLLQRQEVLDGAVGGIGDHACGTKLVAEDGPPQLVAEGLILHDIPRSDERMENETGLAAIDQIVILIAKGGPAIPHQHRRCIGISPADLAGRKPLVARRQRALGV